MNAEVARLLLKKGGNLLGLKDNCGKGSLVQATVWAPYSTVKVLLECLDEREMPFEEVGPIIEEVIAETGNYHRCRKKTEILLRWYWRSLYPWLK